ncbi:MAG: hypothetical protein HOG49_40065 [Candidatus Scalindua sp.]|jgi:hypothetical protein|nr:hypothetical protein [Candidatus Scalindua sp.]
MSFSVDKQPDETLRLFADFRNDLRSGDSISSATYVVTSGDTVVTDALTVSGSGQISNENPNDVPSVNDTASVKVISGDSGVSYKLTVLGSSANGEVFESDINIHVLDT